MLYPFKSLWNTLFQLMFLLTELMMYFLKFTTHSYISPLGELNGLGSISAVLKWDFLIQKKMFFSKLGKLFGHKTILTEYMKD